MSGPLAPPRLFEIVLGKIIARRRKVHGSAGIAETRPFVSGTLGSAFVIATTFQRCNGLLFTGKELPVVESVLDLAQGNESESASAHYLRYNSGAV